MSVHPKPKVVFFDLGNTLIFTSGGQRKPYADAHETLQILEQRGYRLGLLSNQSPGKTVSQVWSEMVSLGFAHYLERELVTISTEIPGNVGKPHQPIFDLALEKAGYDSATAETVFVTETLGHVEAARGFGWRAILKRSSGACLASEGECAVGLAPLLGLLPATFSAVNTNLDLAPQAKLVDGLFAVPIDIRRITARLTFDGATQSAAGDATIEFRMGRTGNPIFDLRQTVTAAWLDGSPIPAADVGFHDFGGGTGAELRVLDRSLAADTNHTLRLTYDVAHPQASSAGSYQPQVTWSPGPSLTFNFGMTDLGPGRYLEAFVPANLVYDQYELEIELRMVNSAVAHTLITNGTVTTLGANHWSASWPARITAFSPLVEIRRSSTVTSQTDSTVLPVSGRTVAITAWKRSSSGLDLGAQINDIKSFLAANESTSGVYAHDDRFLAFFITGGMEYDGATTTGTGALRHETYHSWWGRGLKPASQPDAWVDEAWDTYNDAGASGSVPFDFTDPPVTLRPSNPWVRVTSGLSYSKGREFFEGVADRVTPATLVSLMREFYTARRGRPATTEQIEEFLVCRTGDPLLVDAFHRFVYGFGNPSPAPDLWLKDHPAHLGSDFWGDRFWDSPDLWIRNYDDGGLSHQPPEYGQDNWFYARVRNRSTTGTARHFLVTFNVKSFAGVQFTYPGDFLPCIAAASGFELGPGESRVVRARWPRALVPAAGTHACWLAAVHTRSENPLAGRHVWEHNNLAQKNLTVVDLRPGDWFVLPVVVTNLARIRREYILEVARPRGQSRLKIELLHPKREIFPADRRALRGLVRLQPSRESRTLDCGNRAASRRLAPGSVWTSRTTDTRMARRMERSVAVAFKSGLVAGLPVQLERQQQLRVGLRVHVPRNAVPGRTIRVDLVKRDPRTQRIVGGVAAEIRVQR